MWLGAVVFVRIAYLLVSEEVAEVGEPCVFPSAKSPVSICIRLEGVTVCVWGTKEAKFGFQSEWKTPSCPVVTWSRTTRCSRGWGDYVIR